MHVNINLYSIEDNKINNINIYYFYKLKIISYYNFEKFSWRLFNIKKLYKSILNSQIRFLYKL